jgi:hypothetical protein
MPGITTSLNTTSKRGGIPFELRQGLVRIVRKYHVVIELAQGADGKFGHIDVVFHHQHAHTVTMLQPR